MQNESPEDEHSKSEAVLQHLGHQQQPGLLDEKLASSPHAIGDEDCDFEDNQSTEQLLNECANDQEGAETSEQQIMKI